MYGASYDLHKAFDQLPCAQGDFAWDLMKRLGFPSCILTLMQDLYLNLERRFKFNGILGEAVQPDGLRGAVQGCSFSMVIMNVAAMA